MSRLKKFIPFVCGLLFGVTGNVYGVKSNPNPVTVVQPDGTALTIRIHGDENFHYTTTVDGFLIRKDKDRSTGYMAGYYSTDKKLFLNSSNKQFDLFEEVLK